ncbi:MAG TPA: hypothetical protein VGR18_11540 [Rubrobacter sp.]|nr:hypothetical protein [Rubrobacter sp.]
MNFSCVLMMTSGQKMFPHWLIKVTMPRAAHAAFMFGRTKRKNAPNSPLPSMRAASSRSLGKPIICWRIRKTPKPVTW